MLTSHALYLYTQAGHPPIFISCITTSYPSPSPPTPLHHMRTHIHKYKKCKANKTRAADAADKQKQLYIEQGIGWFGREEESTRLLSCGRVVCRAQQVKENLLLKGQGRNNTTGGPAQQEMCACEIRALDAQRYMRKRWDDDDPICPAKPSQTEPDQPRIVARDLILCQNQPVMKRYMQVTKEILSNRR